VPVWDSKKLGFFMQMIETVIKPNRLDAVETALAKMDVGFVPKVLLKICANDTDVEQAVNVIIEAARTGEVGDGKISFTQSPRW